MSKPCGAAVDELALERLCHAVIAPNVQERLQITICSIQLPAQCGLSISELRCKAYVGPLKAVRDGPDGKPDKGKLRELRLDVQDGAATVEVDVGIPHPQEPWAIRVKFYRRPASALFTQERIAEVVQAIPLPTSKLSLTPSGVCQQTGCVVLRVVRVVPTAAVHQLIQAAGSVLVRAVRAGVAPDEIQDLCGGLRELGPDALVSPQSMEVLDVAAGQGSREVVENLLAAGIPATSCAARLAEQATTEGHLVLAKQLLLRSAPSTGEEASCLLVRALRAGMPLLAEMTLQEEPDSLDRLPPDGGAAARQAHAVGAWSVLAALLRRGDPMPAPTRQLLDYALRAGHAGLARACLARWEDAKDIERALRTCLDHGRIEIVREALEVQWKIRSQVWSAEGPPLLTLEFGNADEPAECGVCFEPLHRAPGVFVCSQGFRVCQHFCCLSCAEHVQDEATERVNAWRSRRDPRLPQPPPPSCPMCRAPFASAVRLVDPTVDPKNFFRLACVPEEKSEGHGTCSGTSECTHKAEDLRLTEKTGLATVSALLPVNAASFTPKFVKELWPSWCAECGQEALRETDFLRPGGMLAWICDHLLEKKVEDLRGPPPRLQDDAALWFQHFDYLDRGRLSKAELLRGFAKVYDVEMLANPSTPARKRRAVGIGHLREIVDAVWDETRWADGIPLCDFEGRRGLAQRVLDALPGEHVPISSPTASSSSRALGSVKPLQGVSVEEALAQARASDFNVRRADEERAKERMMKLRTPEAFPANGRPGPGRAGAELLLASLLEASREQAARPVVRQMRIQCPFCSAINMARAAAGNRVICGSCRSVFAVPSA